MGWMRPFAVILDSNNNIIIADMIYNNRIIKLSSNGTLLLNLPFGDNLYPTYILPAPDDSGDIFIAMYSYPDQSRVSRYSSDFVELVRYQTSNPPLTWNSGGFGFDSAGNLYVEDGQNNRIAVFTTEKIYDIAKE